MLGLRLRDYQSDAVNAVVTAVRDGKRRQLIVLPTGAGKTLVAAALSQRTKGRTLFLCHRDELVRQALEKFRIVWPDADIGVVKGPQNEPDRRIVIASVQSLQTARRRAAVFATPPTLIIADEAHHAPSPSWRTVLEAAGVWPNPEPQRLLVGVTATPFRGDKIGLGHVFEETVFRRGIADLIRAGYLANIRAVRVASRVDLSRVHMAQADLVPAEWGRGDPH